MEFSYYYNICRGFFPSEIPSEDQLIDYILMVVQDQNSIYATEDALFGASVRIIWYWLSFNAQRGK